MKIVKHFYIKKWKIYLGGFYIITNHTAVDFLGTETAIGIMRPQRSEGNGRRLKGLHYRKINPWRP